MKPHVYVGSPAKPYSLRWFLFQSRRDRRLLRGRRVRWIDRVLDFNICVHKFLRADPPGLHDHSWWNVSIILKGRLREEVEGGERILRPGRIVVRRSTTAHRLTPIGGPAWTLFITGPWRREWGYWRKGKWINWRNVR